MTTATQSPPTAKPLKNLRLPKPAELPDAAIVIYDGHCKFCTGQVKNLARWDGKGRVAFISLHDPEVARRWPELTHEMLMDQMYLFDPHGNRYCGAAAFRYLSRLLPRLWILAPLMHIPFSLPIWQFLYRQVAKRRYLMGKTAEEACDDGGCKVHFK
jgi:predicted DCC family thiol-disulfide oxidoreductase YuxK